MNTVNTNRQPMPGAYNVNLANTNAQLMPGAYNLNSANTNAQPMPEWMVRPTVPNCPPGLEYLTQIDQLLVKQHIEIMEVITGINMSNKYSILNSLGQLVFLAREETDMGMQVFYGSNRKFTIDVFDNNQSVVMVIKRPYKCRCFSPCCNCIESWKDEVVIESPPGQVIGYVKQVYKGCKIRYAILDQNGIVVLRIHGPNLWKCYCPGDEYPFQIMSVNEDSQVGKISKQWTNYAQEYYTKADNFGIQFPIDLDVKIKAVLLGAVFLIDFMYFEGNKQNNQRRPHSSFNN